MPHLYSDRRLENEEIQKLLHIAMLRKLVAYAQEFFGASTPMTWETIQDTASHAHPEHGRCLDAVRREAMAEVAAERRSSSTEAAYGAERPVRRQFKVSFINGIKRPRVLKQLASTQEGGPEARLKALAIAGPETLQMESGSTQLAIADRPEASPSDAKRNSEAVDSRSVRQPAKSDKGSAIAATVRVSAEDSQTPEASSSARASDGRPEGSSSVATQDSDAVGSGSDNPVLQSEAESAIAAPVQPSAAEDEWVFTRTAQYLHAVEYKDGELYRRCKWRQRPSRVKPINSDLIIWRGDRAAALRMSIPFCTDEASQI